MRDVQPPAASGDEMNADARPPDPPRLERVVHCEDAVPWLRANAPLLGCSLITSLPDVSSFPEWSLEQWQRWFVDAARATMAATPDQGVTIFYQTDIKREGVWVDKGYLCHEAAAAEGAALLWHKIVCRKPPGNTAFGRPGFAHLLCYSRGVRDQVARSTADVLPSTGEMIWSQATGVAACEAACRYVRSHTASTTIVDPFCGRGTVLAVANRLGFRAVGVEIGRKRARQARNLRA
jgi:hypothetical protein